MFHPKKGPNFSSPRAKGAGSAPVRPLMHISRFSQVLPDGSSEVSRSSAWRPVSEQMTIRTEGIQYIKVWESQDTGGRQYTTV